jgi:hypothetical protein
MLFTAKDCIVGDKCGFREPTVVHGARRRPVYASVWWAPQCVTWTVRESKHVHDLHSHEQGMWKIMFIHPSIPPPPPFPGSTLLRISVQVNRR